MRFTYDNSYGNAENPHHPPVRVTAGQRSTRRDGEPVASARASLGRRPHDVDGVVRQARSPVNLAGAECWSVAARNAWHHLRLLGSSYAEVGRNADAIVTSNWRSVSTRGWPRPTTTLEACSFAERRGKRRSLTSSRRRRSRPTMSTCISTSGKYWTLSASRPRRRPRVPARDRAQSANSPKPTTAWAWCSSRTSDVAEALDAFQARGRARARVTGLSERSRRRTRAGGSSTMPRSSMSVARSSLRPRFSSRPRKPRAAGSVGKHKEDTEKSLENTEKSGHGDAPPDER